jgi:hypothetical protein
MEQATGVRIVIVHNRTPDVFRTGGASLRDGALYLFEGATRPLTLVAAHEWVHELKRSHPKLYAQLELEVRQQGRLVAYQRHLQRSGHPGGANRDLAYEELTADAVADAMTDPAFLQRLAKRNQGLFKRVAQAFIDFLRTLGASWTNQGTNEYLQNVEAFRDQLAAVLDLYRRDGPGAVAADKAFQQTWDAVPAQMTPPSGAPLAQRLADTAQEFGGREAWQRARDDGRTELPFEAWLLVRTPEYKQNNGDWESVLPPDRRTIYADTEGRIERGLLARFVPQQNQRELGGHRRVRPRIIRGESADASTYASPVRGYFEEVGAAEVDAESQKLIARARTAGFFWDARTVERVVTTANLHTGGQEHDTAIFNQGENHIVIRRTINGDFGFPESSPSQYLKRVEDYNHLFPHLQVRVIGVSQNADRNGRAVIWTAQPFVDGEAFDSDAELEIMMLEHGWDRIVPDEHNYIHRRTGAVITDALGRNVLRHDGDLFPIDVIVHTLPAEFRTQSDPSTVRVELNPRTGECGPRVGSQRGISRVAAERMDRRRRHNQGNSEPHRPVCAPAHDSDQGFV